MLLNTIHWNGRLLEIVGLWQMPAQLNAANLYATNNVAGLLVVNPFNVANNQIVGVDGKLNPNAKLLYADDLDWEKQLARTGVRRSVDFSYQGRSETSNYFVSISNLKDEGVIKCLITREQLRVLMCLLNLKNGLKQV